MSLLMTIGAGFGGEREELSPLLELIKPCETLLWFRMLPTLLCDKVTLWANALSLVEVYSAEIFDAFDGLSVLLVILISFIGSDCLGDELG